MDGVSSPNNTRPFTPTTHPRKSPTCILSLISNRCQSSPLEKLIPRNTLNKLNSLYFHPIDVIGVPKKELRDIYFWRCSPIMSFTNMASPSMNMYCDGHLMRSVKGSAFPVFSSVLSLRDEPLKLCRRVVSRGNNICSAAPESSTATVDETKEATKVESESPPAKPKRVAPAKSPAKPLLQMMEEDVIPSLTTILEAQEDLSQIELSYEDNTVVGGFFPKKWHHLLLLGFLSKWSTDWSQRLFTIFIWIRPEYY